MIYQILLCMFICGSISTMLFTVVMMYSNNIKIEKITMIVAYVSFFISIAGIGGLVFMILSYQVSLS